VALTQSNVTRGIVAENIAELRRLGSKVTSTMDKKEINSPTLTLNFVFWICGVGGLVLLILLAHFVWKVL
jgi:hypothetical protein